MNSIALDKAAPTPLVDAANFVLATRDSGYRSPAYAVAEFVDNSIQAGASSVSVHLLSSDDSRYPIEVLITDDGSGMDAKGLTAALAFGGSSRFDDRSSLGRYGMGLPNGALSFGRRVEVYTWRRGRTLMARLDVDELLRTRRRTLPPVEYVRRPAFIPKTTRGTAVLVRRCDRLPYRRASALASKLHDELGRIYHRFLEAGLGLSVNGAMVEAVDPLLRGRRGTKARRFGDELVYELDNGAGASSQVRVVFTELPVERWHDLTSAEKKKLGITAAPPVSVMRASREIDRGWFFMGAKRRENYDDWWRCEISFEPAVDELFGITHAKLGISPRPELLELLERDLEPIARALNSRVRRRFELAKATRPLSEAERQAARAHPSLPPLPRGTERIPTELRHALKAQTAHQIPYQIAVAELTTTAAFEIVMRAGQLALVFNADHPLYRDLYGPLASSDSPQDQDVAKRVALAILAAARAEVTATRRGQRDEVRRFRQAWADVLATFFIA